MQAFVFDLDGTLLNTLEDIGNACNHMLARHGYATRSIEEYRYMVGNGFAMLVRRCLGESLPDNVADLTEEARKRYREHMLECSRPYPGMVPALRQLADKGVLAVLSNKPDDLSRELISHYFPDIPFAKVLGARPDYALKPDPHTLLDLMTELGCIADCTCYIGDSNVDIITAHNAGISGIGAAWGFRGVQELKAAGADKILFHPTDLPTLCNMDAGFGNIDKS